MLCSLSAVTMSFSFVMAGYFSSQVYKCPCAVGLDNLVQVDHVRLDDLQSGSQERIHCSFAHATGNHGITAMCGLGEMLVYLLVREPAIQRSVATNVLSLIHISEPTRLGMISYAVF